MPLRGGGCFKVQKGDRFGYMSKTDQAPIGYSFLAKGVNIIFLPINGTDFPKEDEKKTFDSLQWPYEFAIAVVVDEGE